ncbi:MAG TPA: DegQ family serine endoprotease [Gammaproteobacteria bacterium]
MKRKVLVPVYQLLSGFILLTLLTVAQARELPDFTVLVEQNSAAVVNISTTQKPKQRPPFAQKDMPGLPQGTPWDDLFRHFFGDEGEGPGPEEAQSLGSGFIIDTDGYVLTNNHVVEDAEEILVLLSDRRELKAKLIGSDKRSDIALLKVDARNLPVVKIGKSEKLKVGEWVMAIGSPFGFDHSVSVGVVSALGRNLPSENYVPFIQTDVAINPGNSGGPLFNLDGEVVGINSQIYSRTGGFMGLSFAIPIDVAMEVVAQLKSKGYVARGWLGVLIQDVTRDLAESFGMKTPSGALVSKVLDESPAAKAGLKTGDVILEFDGKAINRSSDLPPLAGHAPIGSTVKLKILRNGKTQTVQVKVAELPSEEKLAEASTTEKKGKADRLGLTVADLNAEQRKALEIERNGVLVQEIEEGAAAEAGIRRGDVILKINGNDVDNVAQLRKLVEGLPAGKSVPVLVQRRNGPIFLALRVPEGK